MVLNYNADGKKYTGDFVGGSMEDTLISAKMIPEFFSFGTRVNVNIEGQLEYLIELEKIVKKFLPKDSGVSADVEARPVVQKIDKVETTKNLRQAIDGEKGESLETHELVSEPTTAVDEKTKVATRKYKNMITKEVGIEILTDFIDKQEKENKTQKQIKAHLEQKKDDLEMSDNIDGDAIVAIKDFKYDRITAEDALKQLNDKVKEFTTSQKQTKVQENNLEVMKQNLIKKVRKNEPYVFLKKLKAWHWARPIDTKEIQREIALSIDKSDLAYIESQIDIKKPYSHREAKEMQRIAYEEQKEKFSSNLKLTSPDATTHTFPIPFEFKQYLSQIEIKERIAFAYLELNAKTKDIERYEKYLESYRHRDTDQKLDNISSLLGRRLDLDGPRRLADSNNPKDTKEM